MVDKSFECENASENAATRFDPVHNPRPLWDAPDHPERTRAALGSLKANVARGTISAARLRPERGNHGPLVYSQNC